MSDLDRGHPMSAEARLTEAEREALVKLAEVLMCSQCGHTYNRPACGPSHAIIAADPRRHRLVAPLIAARVDAALGPVEALAREWDGKFVRDDIDLASEVEVECARRLNAAIAQRRGGRCVADATVARIEAVLAASCHHCGRLPDDDGDHTCPCPRSDSECLEHTADPVAPLLPIRAAIAEGRTAAGGGE